MLHVIISGEVQGVGFRQYLKYQAKKLNVRGWVKNLPDGSVEAVIAGTPENVEKMVNFSKRGPFLAEVKDIKIEEITEEVFSDFQIIKEI